MPQEKTKHASATGPFFDGLEVGSVSVKRVRRTREGTVACHVLRHEGNPKAILQRIFDDPALPRPARIVVSGQAAGALLDLPYRSETECLEKALSFHRIQPDIALSLGGETFCVYGMKDGRVRNIVSTSKCAAGTGEFIVQQLQRMGLSIEQGVEAGRSGRTVALASRCSVHCKSDATHKLNKGECSPGDIARSLIFDLSKKVWELIELAQWPKGAIVLCGGVVRNELFMERFRQMAGDTQVRVLPESTCLEAFGAALYASELPEDVHIPLPASWFRASTLELPRLQPLKRSEPLLDYRVRTAEEDAIQTDGAYILGIDAGSTTTKAVLFNIDDGSVGARCYLRTLGNPVQATRNCLEELSKKPGVSGARIVQAGVTGSGRELVSVFLDNGQSFNEILAHARAAVEEVPDVDTVFEIGGQDSKYISFEHGVPIDYAMNEGCSAGTGSFIEESASVDMGIAMEDISDRALASPAPIAFGERCAAFINTDLRNALQQGAMQEDVVAGLACSIADNYVSRVVGTRRIGAPLLFLGGVARNRAVGLALAARTQQKVVVPSYPEFMGCVGVSLTIRDLLQDGRLSEKAAGLTELIRGEMEVKGSFPCKSCENSCEIRKIRVRGKAYPFGGLCSKYERLRHRGKDIPEGRDLVALRNRLMFDDFGPRTIENPRGRVGLPMALTSFELFPFYVKLIQGLGYNVVLSRPSKAGNRKTTAPICYPCEIVHGAVYDLLQQGVDFIFLPHMIEMQIRDGGLHSYTCPSTAMIPDILKAAFSDGADRFLSPHMGLSEHLKQLTLEEAGRMGVRLGVEKEAAYRAAEEALVHYEQFQRRHEEMGKEELEALKEEPAVILAGRPYVLCSSEANLSLPRKIASRGYHVIPADMLPWLSGAQPPRDVWYFTRQISNAVAHVKRNPNLSICLVSCFSCGPDSSMYHFFRQELGGRTFCYLEIDSHTAHAGFETRVGAFLDIVDEQRRRQEQQGEPRAKGCTKFTARRELEPQPARLSVDKDCIIDSDGGRVAYDDPRVVHVWIGNHSPLALKIVRKLYEKTGRALRMAVRTNAEVMQQARELCSGRECIPMTAAVGATLIDIRNKRSPHEISIYYSLDQEGPCQNGAWPLVWETINKRLNLRNVVMGVWPEGANSYLGLGNAFNLFANGGLFLGDLFEEAGNTLLCLARDKEEALNTFEKAFESIVAQFPGEGQDFEEALRMWASRMSALPLKAPLAETPRVLIIGGLNLLFVHDPVEEYFIRQGVLPKVVPYSEGMCWLASENLVRYGLKHGLVNPKEQFARPRRSDNRQELVHARKSRYGVTLMDAAEKRYREIMNASGLLFDGHIPFQEIVEKGHNYASQNAFSETTVTAGRYVCALEAGLFDGIVNLGSFNCQPAMNSQAVIRPLANASEIPYAAIDCEGPWISTNQRRLLETVAVQARRVRAKKKAAGRSYRTLPL